jgi:succinyl-CoA synthetase beta subunit
LRLYEYEGKELFRQYGIATPVGALAKTSDEAREAAANIGKAVLVKAQVLAGGRGKAGGIRTARTPEEAKRVAQGLMGRKIQGYQVRSLLIEEKLDIANEMYLSITIDDRNGNPIAIASAEGGIEIEKIAQRDPTKIASSPIDPLRGIRNYDALKLLHQVGFSGQPLVATSRIVVRLYNAFSSMDARLAEINPLVMTADGRMIAGDARCEIDNHSLFRHPKWQEQQLQRIDNIWEREAADYGVNYLDLDGSIAVMANGAGLTMALMDMMKVQGARAACFLDTGGGLSRERMKHSVGLLLRKAKSDARIKVLLIMVRMMISPPDAVAQGMLEAINEIGVTTPVITIMRGREPYEKRARALLGDSRIKLHSSVEEGLAEAIAIATRG